MSDKRTSNNLNLNIQPLPNGLRLRTLSNPQTNQLVSQDAIGPKTLKSKATQRKQVQR